MAKDIWTEERLRAATPEERARLYANAKRMGTPDALAIAQRIESLGLPFSEPGCVNMDDPIVAKLYEIVFSDESRIAAKKAADDGLPALAGVDPLISKALGADYGKHNMTTHTAGGFIAELMREMGYKETGKSGKTPSGCIATSGQMWETKGG